LIEKYPTEVGEAIVLYKKESARAAKALLKPGITEKETRSIVADQAAAYAEMTNSFLGLSVELGEKAELAGQQMLKAVDKIRLMEVAYGIVEGMRDMREAVRKGVAAFLLDFRYDLESVGAMKGMPRFEELAVGKAMYELTPTERLMKAGEGWQNLYKIRKVLMIYMDNLKSQIGGLEEDMRKESSYFEQKIEVLGEKPTSPLKAHMEGTKKLREHGKKLLELYRAEPGARGIYEEEAGPKTFWERVYASIDKYKLFVERMKTALKGVGEADIGKLMEEKMPERDPIVEKFHKQITAINKEVQEREKALRVEELVKTRKEELKERRKQIAEIERLYKAGYYAKAVKKPKFGEFPIARSAEEVTEELKKAWDWVVRWYDPKERVHMVTGEMFRPPEESMKLDPFARTIGYHRKRALEIKEEIKRLEELRGKYPGIYAEDKLVQLRKQEAAVVGLLAKAIEQADANMQKFQRRLEGLDELFSRGLLLAGLKGQLETLRQGFLVGEATQYERKQWDLMRGGRHPLAPVTPTYEMLVGGIPEKKLWDTTKYEAEIATMRASNKLVSQYDIERIQFNKKRDLMLYKQDVENEKLMRQRRFMESAYGRVRELQVGGKLTGQPQRQIRTLGDWMRDMLEKAPKIVRRPEREPQYEGFVEFMNVFREITAMAAKAEKEARREAAGLISEPIINELLTLKTPMQESNNILRGIRTNTAGIIEAIKGEELPAIEKQVGGKIFGPGGPKEDRVPILASPGEYILREQAAKAIGYGRLSYMNKTGQLPGFAEGNEVEPLDYIGMTRQERVDALSKSYPHVVAAETAPPEAAIAKKKGWRAWFISLIESIIGKKITYETPAGAEFNLPKKAREGENLKAILETMEAKEVGKYGGGLIQKFGEGDEVRKYITAEGKKKSLFGKLKDLPMPKQFRDYSFSYLSGLMAEGSTEEEQKKNVEKLRSIIYNARITKWAQLIKGLDSLSEARYGEPGLLIPAYSEAVFKEMVAQMAAQQEKAGVPSSLKKAIPGKVRSRIQENLRRKKEALDLTKAQGGLIQTFQGGGKSIAEILREPSIEITEAMRKFFTGETAAQRKAIEEAQLGGVKPLSDKEREYLEKLRKIWKTGEKSSGGLIPEFHTGGVMPHTGLAYLQGGEVVTNPRLREVSEGGEKIGAAIEQIIERAVDKLESIMLKVDVADVKIPVDVADSKVPIDLTDVELRVANLDDLERIMSTPLKVDTADLNNVGVGAERREETWERIEKTLLDRFTPIEEKVVDADKKLLVLEEKFDKKATVDRNDANSFSEKRLHEVITSLETDKIIPLESQLANIENQLSSFDASIKDNMDRINVVKTTMDITGSR